MRKHAHRAGAASHLLRPQEAEHLHLHVPQWEIRDEARRIERTFRFPNFREAFAHVQQVAELAEAEGHHPDISFGWGYVTVVMQTKKIKGLHENDFGDATPQLIGRLVARGLDDELKGTAYAIIDGVDGRAHHVRLADLDAASDAMPGSIVELRQFQDAVGRQRVALAVRSDLPIDAQVQAGGATWLDRLCVPKTQVRTYWWCSPPTSA